ncbi:MAG: hypothetical protein DCC64_06540 [Planctomycetota bacterium]|nr:MAG: hypothetical protein DCC64_06540 [Planctomycetota bacterium]
MIRLRIGLLIGGLAALVFGGQSLFTWLSNLSPTQMTYENYCSQRPAAKWLELSNTWVDYRFAVEIQTISKGKYSSGPGTVTNREYYVPMYKSRDDESNVIAFLKCHSDESVKLAREAANTDIPDEDAQAQWIQNNDQRMNRNITVKGLVLYGLHESSEDRKLLNQAARGRLVDDFVIIDENEEPAGGLGFLLVLLGVGLVGGVGWSFFKKSPQQPPRPQANGYVPMAQRMPPHAGPPAPMAGGAALPARQAPLPGSPPLPPRQAPLPPKRPPPPPPPRE